MLARGDVPLVTPILNELPARDDGACASAFVDAANMRIANNKFVVLKNAFMSSGNKSQFKSLSLLISRS